METTDIDAHRLNKREAFDGMRAYHQSEISHKKDCIDILRSILTAVLAVYGGLVGVTLAREIAFPSAMFIALILLAFITTSVVGVVWATNGKIDQDNMRYRKYQDEYKIERLALRLEPDLWSASYVSAWFEPQLRNRTGYHFTKVVLRVYGLLVVGAAALGTLLIFSMFSSR